MSLDFKTFPGHEIIFQILMTFDRVFHDHMQEPCMDAMLALWLRVHSSHCPVRELFFHEVFKIHGMMAVIINFIPT